MAQAARVEAFLLHARRYRERSQVADLLTDRDERIGCLLHGSRRGMGVEQPFRVLSLGLRGRGELYTATAVETLEHVPLSPQAMICGLYLNELLIRLTVRNSPLPGVYALYLMTLRALLEAADPEPALRRFERDVLACLGYGLELTRDADTGAPIDMAAHYRFVPEHGLRRVPRSERGAVAGASVLALARDELHASTVLADSKCLLGAVLKCYLGPQPLRSRALWPASAEPNSA